MDLGRYTLVHQGHGRLSVVLFQRHRHCEFERPIARHPDAGSGDDISLLIGKAIRTDDLFIRDDLFVGPGAPVYLAVRSLHGAVVFPADTKINRGLRTGETLRPPPLLVLLVIGPGSEHAVFWRIKGAHDGQGRGSVHRRGGKEIKIFGKNHYTHNPIFPRVFLSCSIAKERVLLTINFSSVFVYFHTRGSAYPGPIQSQLFTFCAKSKKHSRGTSSARSVISQFCIHEP